jgi:alkylated DNA repair dioxygenase AlkB
MARPRRADKPPEGFRYEPDVIDEAEERSLLAHIEQLDFAEIHMHGVVARRTAAGFGMGYDYGRREPVPGAAPPMPEWLVPARDRCAEVAGLPGEALVQTLVQRYPPGAPIGWHTDAPAFEVVVGLSLLGSATIRLRTLARKDRLQYDTVLAPRSVYVLAGDARWRWEHHIPPAKELRFSVTWRALRRRNA